MSGITFTEGSGLNNSVFGNSQAAIRMFIEKKAESFEQESIMSKVFMMEKSNNYAEKISTMTAMEGFLPVGELGNHPLDGMQEGYDKTIEHMTWKNKFIISREIIDDSKALDLRKRPEAFVSSYYRTRELFAAGLLTKAIDSTSMTYGGRKFSTLCADGKKLFSHEHPSKVKGSSQCNLYTNAFSADALGLVETAMQKYKGDNNEILSVVPDTIIIPNNAALKKEVFAAVGADKDPATANNGFNYQFGRWNIIVWPYLNSYDDSTPFWIVADSKYNEAYGSAVWFDRVKLEVDSYVDRETNGNIWTGYSRFGAGFNDWRGFAVAGTSATGAETLA